MDVTNINGKVLDFDAAVNLMDDDIREQLVNRQDWQSDQEFFTAYEQAHAAKYGEEWELSKRNPVW
jgi:hypothetical protein